MNLTYLAITAGIVLGTIVVYALLSWGRSPEEQPDETTAAPADDQAALQPRPARSPRPRATERQPDKTRRNAS